jgi:hypothetical protein
MRLADGSIAAAFLRGPSDGAAVAMIGEGIAQSLRFGHVYTRNGWPRTTAGHVPFDPSVGQNTSRLEDASILPIPVPTPRKRSGDGASIGETLIFEKLFCAISSLLASPQRERSAIRDLGARNADCKRRG